MNVEFKDMLSKSVDSRHIAIQEAKTCLLFQTHELGINVEHMVQHLPVL